MKKENGTECILRRFTAILLFIVMAAGAAVKIGRADNPAYTPTAGIDDVRAKVSRLEGDYSGVGAQARQTLLSEGKSILDLEREKSEEMTPLQQESKQAVIKGEDLYQREKGLERRIQDYNNNPNSSEDPERLQEEIEELKRERKEFEDYKRDLNDRLDAENRQFSERVRAFSRNAENFITFVLDAYAVRSAVANGQKPPFAKLAKIHYHSREIAKGLAPEENRCALVLSMALGISPRKDKQGKGMEASLNDLKTGMSAGMWDRLKKEVKTYLERSYIENIGSEPGDKYYVNSRQLADRLEELWKQDTETAEGKEQITKMLKNRNGIVFFEGGFGGGNHIDVWNGKQMSWNLPTVTKFEQASFRAKRVRFWELKD